MVPLELTDLYPLFRQVKCSQKTRTLLRQRLILLVDDLALHGLGQHVVAIRSEHARPRVVQPERLGSRLKVLDRPPRLRDPGLLQAEGEAAAAGEDVEGAERAPRGEVRKRARVRRVLAGVAEPERIS